MDSQRNRAAIVGIGSTNFGDLYRTKQPSSAYELAGEAFKLALEDCGIDKAEIDGIVCVRLPSYQRVAAEFGLSRLRFAYSLEGTGRMAGVALQQTVDALAIGRARTVAILYGNNGRSAGDRYGGQFDATAPGAYDAMYGMTSPGAYVAMMFRRHQYEYATPNDGLAALAINNRNNAALNDLAVLRKPISKEEYYDAPFIAEPLRLLDYCLINDGGVCLIVTTGNRARRARQPAAYIAASATASNLTAHYTSKDFFFAACAEVAADVYRTAGISAHNVGCAQIYDNFTPTILFALEGFGFCKRGESGHWVQGGRVALGGDLPINTSGGHTAEGYMQGFGLLAEAVRQVRGQAGKRQVKNCEFVQYNCVSPIVSAVLLHH